MECWRDMLTFRPEFTARHETYCAMLENRTVGFYALGRKDERLDLLHMWVLPEAMGRGIGRANLELVYWRSNLTRTRRDSICAWGPSCWNKSSKLVWGAS